MTAKKQRQRRRAMLLRHFHAVMTIGWGVMIPVSLLTSLKTSLPYIVGLSVYALFIGHFASWQGSRAETSDE